MKTVSINGELKRIPETHNLHNLLQYFEYNTDDIAVSINMTFVSRSQYDKTHLNDGDKIDILAAIQGG